jgi:NitT/TauT family transport system permease protein
MSMSVSRSRGVRPRSGRGIRSALPGVLLLAALLVLWVIVKYAVRVPDEQMPTPVEVARAGWADRGQLLAAAGSTLEGALGGFLLGNALAVLAAVLIASSAMASRLLVPVALVVRTFPIIAIAPLLTLLLGTGTITIVAVAALIIFFPTMINGVLGLRSVPPAALELMAIAEASPLDVLWRVRLPTALPYIFSGLQVGAATCILGAMVAEWVTTGTGLGYLILQAGVQFDVGLMWAGVLLAALLALIVFALTGGMARRLIPEVSADAS